MSQTQDFYNTYHRQNDRFNKQIGLNNFTYFYILQLLRQACPTGNWSAYRVLDVGCGVGTLALWCTGQGAKVTGLDVSDRAIRLATAAAKSMKLKQVEFKVAQLQAGSGRYDLAICTEVIEHVPNDVQLLQRLHSQLKPGGTLILTTPSRSNLLYMLGYYREFDFRVGHLRRYTLAEIATLVQDSGFVIKELRQVEGPLRNLLFTSPLGFLIKGIRGPLVPFFHWFDAISAGIFGAADIQLIATKI